MGHEKSKPTGPPPPDMMEICIGMKMKAKMFNRQAGKAQKEKTKYYEMAKKEMKKGNEEGARMYLELVNSKEQEYKQFMRMGVRLEVLQNQVRSKSNSAEMVEHLNSITPVLEMQSADMPIEQMYNKLERFNNAYDDLTIKGNILDDGMEKTLGEKGGYKNVDQNMNALKAEVQMEMGVPMDVQVQQPQQQTQANNDFYADLKNL